MVKVEVVESATQTEEKEAKRATHVEDLDVIMGKDSSPSKAEVKDDSLVTAPLVTKKQVERRQSTKAGKKSYPAKNTPPVGDNAQLDQSLYMGFHARHLWWK